MMSTPLPTLINRLGDMDFAHRLATERKDKGLTQQALADRVGIHVSQLRRYEAGTNQPTLDVLRSIALALSVSIDTLVFADTERGPTDDLRLAFEATSTLDPEEQATIRQLIEAMLLRHQVRATLNPAS
jgi:transcriptional regulator with XRE-family HTH domain